MRATARSALSARRLGPAALVLALGACGSPRAPLVVDPRPVFRGHDDLMVSADSAIPHVLGRSRSIGICVDAAPGADTSQWEARLLGGGFVAPAARLGTTLCFENAVPQELNDGAASLCTELRDRFDGRTQRLPCVPFRFDADDRGLRELEGRIPDAVAAGSSDRIDALAGQARDQGFPALALRVRLIAAYTLRREGSETARAEAGSRLREEPPWIGAPAASRWAGQLDYERAMLALDLRAGLARCWSDLRSAERRFRVCAERKWIAVVGKQAEVLSRAGALGEAKERLRAAIEACGAAPCDPALVRAAQNTLAWLVISDPDAGREELASCERSLEDLLDGDRAPREPLEHANLLLNLAFARLRRGEPPEAPLLQARERIGRPVSSRARELAGWADLVEGRRALAAGAPARAAAIGDRVGATGESGRLRAAGLSCAAAAYRRLAARGAEADRIARALVLQASPAATDLGQDVPLGPGQRAEDVYAAARLEVDRGRPDAAWSILRGLDAEAAVASGPAPPTLAPLAATLDDLERPASAPRRAQREGIRRETLDTMQEIVRAARSEPGGGGAEPAFRALPLDDEIVVLRRTDAGAVLYRRTPMRRPDLVETIRATRAAIERGEADDARWIARLEPLARALAPRPEDLGPVTTFAMHGILQEIPLAALPVGSGPARRWLGELTTVAWCPAGAGTRERGPRASPGEAVFVIDPREDLGVSSPPAGARVLRGAAATRESLRSALARGRWLHVDAHARYEPAFPELSTILLADGLLTGQELAAWASGLEFANLSGCETGRSPVSADSGRFGLAGLLARGGVAWVVGSRAALPNGLAIQFNRELYAGLSGGADVPEAFRRALDAVRAKHPASRWAPLLLLHVDPPGSGGQTGAGRTPLLAGSAR